MYVSAAAQLMALSQATGTQTAAGTQDSAQKPNDLGKDDFLKLLITQLRWQDPTQAMDDREFVSQLAQFSTLEQTQNLSKNLETLLGAQIFSQQLAQAASLVGKTVTVLDTDGKEVSGKVSSVRVTQGTVSLVVDGKEYALTDLVAVAA